MFRIQIFPTHLSIYQKQPSQVLGWFMTTKCLESPMLSLWPNKLKILFAIIVYFQVSTEGNSLIKGNIYLLSILVKENGKDIYIYIYKYIYIFYMYIYIYLFI